MSKLCLHRLYYVTQFIIFQFQKVLVGIFSKLRYLCVHVCVCLCVCMCMYMEETELVWFINMHQSPSHFCSHLNLFWSELGYVAGNTTKRLQEEGGGEEREAELEVKRIKMGERREVRGSRRKERGQQNHLFLQVVNPPPPTSSPTAAMVETSPDNTPSRPCRLCTPRVL